MGSRIRDRKSVKKLFECYIVVEAPWGQNSSDSRNSLVRSPSSDPSSWTPVVRSVYPPTYKDQEILKTAAQFSFPCPTNSENVDLFTFVLTSSDSKWTFGYCRHPPHAKTCTLFVTFLPWQEIFYRILNYCAEASDQNALEFFLQTMYNSPIPEAGTCLYIPTMTKPFIYPCPPDMGLSSIPENRNVSEFYNALGIQEMITLFAALLSERRIVVTSRKLSRLSSVVIACNLFLFPMYWQHIYIPVLPTQLQDYLSAPMPFLIGVPILVWDRIPSETLGQVVRVDADSNTVTTPFPEDLTAMPDDVLSHLRKNLQGDKVQGDGLARAFLRALAQLMGHYQEAFRDDGLSFDEELFLHFAHHSHRPYIETKLLRLQIFQQFIEERLQRLRDGSAESDEFELESLAWRSSRANGRNGALRSLAGSQNRAIKKAGKAVMMSMKRESGNFIETFKQNSALKSALRSVKESGKTVKQKGHVAYSDIRSKFHVPSQITSTSSNRNSVLSSSSGEFGHTQLTKTYRRYSGSLPKSGQSENGDKTLQLPQSSTSKMLRNSDDNLVHLSSSSSASKLPDTVPSLNDEVNGVKSKLKPRLSKSEENLIDLDTPDGFLGGSHFTLENPLYEYNFLQFSTNNNQDDDVNDSVFQDTLKKADDRDQDQLLSEYGLLDYFTQLNISSDGSFTTSSNSSGASRSQSNNIHPISSPSFSKPLEFTTPINNSLSSHPRANTNSSSNSNWTTFE